MPASASLGVTLSLATSLLWAISPICFASLGRQIGSWPVVILRILLAFSLLILLLPIYACLVPGSLTMPSAAQVLWLTTSSLCGMVLGDILGFESFVVLGPRRTMQIFMLAPVASVLLGWVLLGEHLSLRAAGGIILVLAASFYAVVARPGTSSGTSREPGRVSIGGIAIAVTAAVFVGAGAVAGRQAFRTGAPLDAYIATLVRVGSGTVMLWIVPVLRGTAKPMLAHLRSPSVPGRLIAGVLCGPFGGMLCYIFALKNLQAGLVSTLAALSPLIMLPIVAIHYRTRIGLNVVAATAAAIAGVAMISMR